MMTIFIRYKNFFKVLGAFILALYIHLWLTKIDDEDFKEDVNVNEAHDKDRLTFVTYNLWCNYLVKSGANYVERFDGFAKGVKNYDIVMIQEAFVLRVGPIEFSNCAAHLADAMKLRGFKYRTSIAASVPFTFGQSNGIMIFSKIPFTGTKSVTFDTANIVERVNNKGFVYTELKVKGNPMFIFNTHTDAHGEKYRTAQMTQLTSIIKKYPPTAYIIAGGDFNINPNNPPLDGNEEEYKKLVQMMSDVGLSPVFTERNKTHLNGGCYDHVFISSNMVVVQKKGINLLTDKGEMVSDHFGLFMEVKLN